MWNRNNTVVMIRTNKSTQPTLDAGRCGYSNNLLHFAAQDPKHVQGWTYPNNRALIDPHVGNPAMKANKLTTWSKLVVVDDRFSVDDYAGWSTALFMVETIMVCGIGAISPTVDTDLDKDWCHSWGGDTLLEKNLHSVFGETFVPQSSNDAFAD